MLMYWCSACAQIYPVLQQRHVHKDKPVAESCTTDGQLVCCSERLLEAVKVCVVGCLAALVGAHSCTAILFITTALLLLFVELVLLNSSIGYLNHPAVRTCGGYCFLTGNLLGVCVVYCMPY